jgi:hypothetical protein
MKFNDEDNKYLRGEIFSAGYSIGIKHKSNCITKKKYLIDKIENTNNIHIGFVDHLPLIDEKIKIKKWLHEDIHSNSKYSLGVDINLEGIEYIKTKYPHYNALYLDLMNDNIPEVIKMKEWDYIILPDVIEHINSPVSFLKSIKEKYSKYCNKLIITAPNATRYLNVKNIFYHKELINSDHRFWFTPYTLAKIVSDAECNVKSFDLVEYEELPRKNFIKKYLLNKYPLLRDTLVMEITLND